MDLEELKKSMKSDLEEGCQKSVVFYNHYIHLERLINSKYSIPLLNKKLDLGIKISYFRNLIATAKSKQNNNKSVSTLPLIEETKEISHHDNSDSKPPIKTKNKETTGETIKNESLLDELKTLFYDISNHLTNDIENLGYGFEDVKIWKGELNISTSRALRKHVSKLKDNAVANQYKI